MLSSFLFIGGSQKLELTIRFSDDKEIFPVLRLSLGKRIHKAVEDFFLTEFSKPSGRPLEVTRIRSNYVAGEVSKSHDGLIDLCSRDSMVRHVQSPHTVFLQLLLGRNAAGPFTFVRRPDL